MPTSIARSIGPLISMMILGAVLPMGAGADDDVHPTQLNGGYNLLHKLAGDESNVSMLMLVKSAPQEITQFTDDVAKLAKKNLETLDHFRDNDAAIRFDQNPLPAIEQCVRDSIKGDKQHQLLFGTSNGEFVRAFLVSQIEATTYGLHLNKVIAEQEASPARARALRHLSNDWGMLRARAYRLLSHY